MFGISWILGTKNEHFVVFDISRILGTKNEHFVVFDIFWNTRYQKLSISLCLIFLGY